MPIPSPPTEYKVARFLEIEEKPSTEMFFKITNQDAKKWIGKKEPIAKTVLIISIRFRLLS